MAKFLLPLQRVGIGALTAILAAAFSGCASFNRIASYPTPQKETSVSIAAKPMSKMSELPIGAYYDEQRHIIVTGHQKGMLAGMMFGVVGVLVADQMNKSSGGTKFGSEAAKGADLGSILNEVLDSSLAEGHAEHWKKIASDAGLQLTPYAVFTVEKTGDARLYAMLRAEIPGKNGDPTWSGRYFVRAAGEYPLQENGWMTDDRFPKAIRAALTRAIKVCIDDTHGRLTGTQTVTAKGRFPFINMDFQLRAIVVQEQSDAIVAKLAVGDAMVLAGTHVLARSDYEIKPAQFKDPRQ
jgi:hypothetical protein